MNYDKPELVSLLASQYVLGTLRGPARRRLERLRISHPQVQEAVQFWEDLLQPLALQIDAIKPPLPARAQMLARAFEFAPLRQPAPIAAAPRRRRRDALRRSVGFLAAASVIGVMLVLGAISLGGGRLSFPASHQRADSAELANADSMLPIYLARVGIPTSSMGWMISLSPDHRSLSIVASDDLYSVGRGTVQLWWLRNGSTPMPLAILGTERDSTVTVTVPPDFESGQSLVFAISLEPSGGSPTGLPSGAVLDRTERDEAI
ncbi:anti-sigma factor [Nevskia sp.]|uniref:anti-sigma factor n=1 Tax=Nevskia sp. TaxID=1929292 RepID=UPI0025F053FB|nr:anti-sigma factor [Nevskia sp.]